MPKKEFPIMEKYGDHLKYIRTGCSSALIANSRRQLLQNLILQDRNVLDNSLYLELLEEEIPHMKEGHVGYGSLSTMVALSKALRNYLGKEVVTYESLKVILVSEFPFGNFTDDIVEWTIDFVMGYDETSTAKKGVLRDLHMYYKELGFEFVDVVFFENPSDFSHFNEVFGLKLKEYEAGQFPRMNFRHMLKTCLAMFLINLSLGDRLNANFFLMKANQIKSEDDMQLATITKLLENTFIFNEVTQ